MEKMYDKDEINAISTLYIISDREEDFELLLKVLEPMIAAALLRIPEVKEHWEDIKQEIFLHLYKYYSQIEVLQKRLKGNIPADYFFFCFRELARHWSKKTARQYDMYNDKLISFGNLSAIEKRELLDEEDPWEMWND